MAITYEEAQRLELVRQLEAARQAAAVAEASATTTPPGLVPTRRSMLDLSPLRTGQIVSGGVPILGRGLNLIAPDAYNPRFPGAALSAPQAPPLRDSAAKIFPDVAAPAAADPMAAWAAMEAEAKKAQSSGSGGGGWRSRPGAVGVAAESDTDKYRGRNQAIIDKMENAIRGDQASQAEILKAAPERKLTDRDALLQRLQAETPMAQRKPELQGYDRVKDLIANMFGSNGRIDLERLGKHKDSLRTKEDDRVAQANKERTDMILKRVDMGALDTGELNAAQDDKLKKLMAIATLQGKHLPPVTAAALDQERNVAQMGQSETQFNTSQAGMDRRHAETLAQQRAQHRTPEAETARKLQEISAAVRLGAKNPGAPGSLTIPQGQALVDNLKFGLKPPEQSFVPEGVATKSQDNFRILAKPFLTDVKDGDKVLDDYAARVGLSVQKHGKNPSAVESVINAYLAELANKYPSGK